MPTSRIPYKTVKLPVFNKSVFNRTYKILADAPGSWPRYFFYSKNRLCIEVLSNKSTVLNERVRTNTFSSADFTQQRYLQV